MDGDSVHVSCRSQQLCLCLARLLGGLAEAFGVAEGDLRLLAGEQVGDGEDLELREFAVARVVEAGGGGFRDHRLGRG